MRSKHFLLIYSKYMCHCRTQYGCLKRCLPFKSLLTDSEFSCRITLVPGFRTMEEISCVLDSVFLGQVGHISSISCWKERRVGNLGSQVRKFLQVREQSSSEEMLNVTLCCSLSSVKRNMIVPCQEICMLKPRNNLCSDSPPLVFLEYERVMDAMFAPIFAEIILFSWCLKKQIQAMLLSISDHCIGFLAQANLLSKPSCFFHV